MGPPGNSHLLPFFNGAWSTPSGGCFNNQSITGRELQWMPPDSFGSCFGHCLEHKGHAVTALTMSLHFKGNWVFLIISHPI